MKVHGHGQSAILSAAEIDKLFREGFATDRDRALFGFCLYTGCRVSEACSLITDDTALSISMEYSEILKAFA